MLFAVPDPTDLDGNRLTLRPWRVEDADQIAEIALDPDIARWNPIGSPTPLEWCRRLGDWTGGQHASWAAVAPADRHTVLGYVSLFAIDPDQLGAEVGYWVAAAHRGRGIATLALGMATEYAFDALALRRVLLYHAADNVGSCRVAERAGYRLEGMHRQSYRYGDGRWHDEHSHARLRSDRITGLTRT